MASTTWTLCSLQIAHFLNQPYATHWFAPPPRGPGLKGLALDADLLIATRLGEQDSGLGTVDCFTRLPRCSPSKRNEVKAQERVEFALVLGQDLFRSLLGKRRSRDSLDVEPSLQERICHDLPGVVPEG